VIMPAPFTACVKSGGRVRTKSLPNNEYMRFCFKNGKSYAGEVHHAKMKRSRPRKRKSSAKKAKTRGRKRKTKRKRKK